MKKTKSIATKIYPLLACIFVFVIAFGAITNLEFRTMKEVVRELAEDYLELEVQNEIVSRNVYQIITIE